MTEWEVVGVIVVMVGLVASVVGPTLKLCNTIAKLSAMIDGAMAGMKELKESDEAMRNHAAESHRRIHTRIDGQDRQLQNHEVRINNLEQKL